jgi:hypothetical protein
MRVVVAVSLVSGIVGLLLAIKFYGLAPPASFTSVKSAVCEPGGITPFEPLGRLSGKATRYGHNHSRKTMGRSGLKSAN